MTNKGMSAINEALTIVEKAPTTFSDDGKAIPVSTMMILEFMLKLVQHAQDNRTKIIDMITDDNRFASLGMSNDMLISVYVLHIIDRTKSIMQIVSSMPPGYPIERLAKLITEQIEQHKATIAKHGIAVV